MAVVTAALWAANAAYAQQAGSIAAAGSASGPTLEAARAAAYVLPESNKGTPVATINARPFRRSETLMIVGGGIFLAGAIIGNDAGTIIMIGGAAMGLYGLYLYLQ